MDPTTYINPDLQIKDPLAASILDRGTLTVIIRILSLVRKISGLAKRIRPLLGAIYWTSPRLESLESVC